MMANQLGSGGSLVGFAFRSTRANTYSNSSLAMTVSTTAAMPGTDDVTTRAMDPISAMTQLLLRRAKMPPTTARTPGITIANGMSARNSGTSPPPARQPLLCPRRAERQEKSPRPQSSRCRRRGSVASSSLLAVRPCKAGAATGTERHVFSRFLTTFRTEQGYLPCLIWIRCAIASVVSPRLLACSLMEPTLLELSSGYDRQHQCGDSHRRERQRRSHSPSDRSSTLPPPQK